jgi:ATP-dependent DNA helicase Q1
VQEGGHGAAAKAMSRDENELVVQQLLREGCLQLDFGFTAYATNVYMKAGPCATAVLQVGCEPV